MDELGGPNDLQPLSRSAGRTPWTRPFQWTKQVASHFGGTRNGLVISWPARIKDKGGIRTQFHHVIDIAPTILEACGVQAPSVLNGVPQKPIEGVSMVYSFDDAKAPSKRRTQYFEMFANRAIYNDGWVAATTPPVAPWDLMGQGPGRGRLPVGALQRGRGLQPGREPRRQGAGQAPRAAGPVLGRGGQVQRDPARQQPGGAHGRHHPAQPDPRPVGVHLLPRPDAHPRGRGAGHQEQVVQDRGGRGHPGRRRRGRDRHPRRALQRLGALPARRQAGVPLQPRRRASLHHRRARRSSPPASTSSWWTSSTTAAASARAPP